MSYKKNSSFIKHNLVSLKKKNQQFADIIKKGNFLQKGILKIYVTQKKFFTKYKK